MSGERIAEASEAVEPKKLLTRRNFWCFALGTFGRDFAYNLFANNLLTFIMFTKTLNESQFAVVSAIIVAARLFDAFNDPIMGGIVENTRTRFGKFRPWILIGGATTSLVIVLLFSLPVDKWAFIGFLAAMYFAFSITFTMNDISYWALLPYLAREADDRNKLSAVTQLVVAAGGGLAAMSIPALTTSYTKLLGGSAVSSYMWLSVITAGLFLASTFVTFFGVNDLTQNLPKRVRAKKNARRRAPIATPEPGAAKGAAAIGRESASADNALSIRDMFRILKNNDQLLVSALVMVLYSVAVGTAGALLTMYIYFEFAYNGMLSTIFWAIGGAMTLAFVATFPKLIKKVGRTKLIVAGGLLIIFGFLFTMAFALVVPKIHLFSLFGLDFDLKYLLMMIPFGAAGLGQGCYYNLMFLNMSNTVEYNEYKTGKREESLIFSLRPFTAKLSSAIQQLLVTVVYLAIGLNEVTNGISRFEREANRGALTSAEKNGKIAAMLKTVPDKKKIALICAVCVIPVAFMVVAMILYRKKFIIDDAKFEEMKEAIRRRKEGEPIASLGASAEE